MLALPSTGKLRFVSLISSTDGTVQFRPCFAVIRHFTGFNECLSGYLVPLSVGRTFDRTPSCISGHVGRAVQALRCAVLRVEDAIRL